MKKHFFLSTLIILVALLFTPLKAQAAIEKINGFFVKITSVAIKDPFYPNYPHRRILFPTIDLSWWQPGGLNRYTFTSADKRIGRKSVTFYSAGYALCSGGLELSLTSGTVPGSTYNHRVCELNKSDDFTFFFPVLSTTTPESVLDSPAIVTGNGGLNQTVYVPLVWWR